MKTRTPLWYVGYCVLLLALGAAYVVMVKGAEASETCCDRHIPEQNFPVKTVTVVEHDRNNAAVAALLGAGITYAIMRYRHRHAAPVVHECSVTKERERHIFETCQAK